MKKLFTIACSIALLNIFSLAHAQTQDSALAKADVSKNVSSPLDTEVPSVLEQTITTPPSSTTVVPFTPFKMDDVRTKRSNIENKVGPNGEDLIIENDKFYYLDEHGQKVEVKRERLQDKPKHS